MEQALARVEQMDGIDGPVTRIRVESLEGD